MRNLSIVIILFMLTACSKKDNLGRPYVAKVENSILTRADAERMILSSSNSNYSIDNVVSDWVDRELMYIAAKRGGLENDETINSRVEKYRKELLGNVFMDNYLNSHITIDEADIRRYYNKNKGSFKRKQAGANVLHFLVMEDSTAVSIAETIRRPADSIDRKELLVKYNVEVSSIEQGKLIAELDNAIFVNDKSGTIIGPIKTDFGHHVIEILSRYSADSEMALEEVRDEIYQRLFNQKKFQESDKYLDSLKNKYSVKINLEQN